jgi:hypothetical protein
MQYDTARQQAAGANSSGGPAPRPAGASLFTTAVPQRQQPMSTEVVDPQWRQRGAAAREPGATIARSGGLDRPPSYFYNRPPGVSVHFYNRNPI